MFLANHSSVLISPLVLNLISSHTHLHTITTKRQNSSVANFYKPSILCFKHSTIFLLPVKTSLTSAVSMALMNVE